MFITSRSLTALTLVAVSAMTAADTLVLPNTLSNNSLADANAVQANFAALAAESNEDNARLTTLESAVKFDLDPGTTALGVGALTSNTTGYFNTSVGVEALLLNAGGYENTALGAETLRANTVGYRNTGVGAAALFNNSSGYRNVAMGYYALLNNTTGHENVAIGVNALNANQTGRDNTALGDNAIFNATSGSFNVAVGAETMLNLTSGTNNTAVGYFAMQLNRDGNGNTAVGRLAMRNNWEGDNNTTIGFESDVAGTSFTHLSNATAIGYAAVVNASNKIRLGNSSVTVIEGAVAFTHPSDARLKEAIEPIDQGLALINDLKPVRYHRIDNAGDDVEMGLLAQDIERTLEKHGLGNSGMIHRPQPDSYLSVRYNDLIAPMIRAIQELDAASTSKDREIAALEQRLAQQELANEALRDQLLALAENQQAQIARLETMVGVTSVADR